MNAARRSVLEPDDGGIAGGTGATTTAPFVDWMGRYRDDAVEGEFVASFAASSTLRYVIIYAVLCVAYIAALFFTFGYNPLATSAFLFVGLCYLVLVVVAGASIQFRGKELPPRSVERWWAATFLVMGLVLSGSASTFHCRQLSRWNGPPYGGESVCPAAPDLHGTIRFIMMFLGRFRFLYFVPMAAAFYVVEVPWRLWGPLPYRYSIATLHDVVVMVIVGILMFVADRRARAAFERHRRLWQSVREASRARHRVDAIIHSQVPAECLAPAEDDAEDGNGPPSGRTAGHAAAAAVVCVALHPPSAEATDWERFGADVEAVWSQLDSTLGALGAEKLLCDAAPLRFVATFGALRGGGAGDVARAGAAALEGLDALQAMRAAGGEGFLGGGSFSAAVAVGEVRWTVDLSRACGVVVEGAAVSEALRRSMVAPNGSIAVGSAVVSITGGRMSFAVLPGRVVVLTGMVSQAASDLGGGLVSSTSSAKLDTSSVSDASLASHLKAQRRAQNRARYARRQALLCVRVRDAAGAEFVAEHSHEVDLPWLRERLSQSSSRIGLGFDDADMETRYRAWRQGRFCALLRLPMLLNAAYVGTLLVMLGVSAGSRAPVEAYALLGSGVAIALLAAVFSRRLHAVAGASVTYIVLVLVAGAMLAFPSVDPPSATPVVSIIADRPIVYFVAWVMFVEAQGSPGVGGGFLPLTAINALVFYAILAAVVVGNRRATVQVVTTPIMFTALLCISLYLDERESRRQFLDGYVSQIADAALDQERENMDQLLARAVPQLAMLLQSSLWDGPSIPSISRGGSAPLMPPVKFAGRSDTDVPHPLDVAFSSRGKRLPLVVVFASRVGSASGGKSTDVVFASTPEIIRYHVRVAAQFQRATVAAREAHHRHHQPGHVLWTDLFLVRAFGDTMILICALAAVSSDTSSPVPVGGVEAVAVALHDAFVEPTASQQPPLFRATTLVHKGSAVFCTLGSDRLGVELVGTALAPLEAAWSAGFPSGGPWFSHDVISQQEPCLLPHAAVRIVATQCAPPAVAPAAAFSDSRTTPPPEGGSGDVATTGILSGPTGVGSSAAGSRPPAIDVCPSRWLLDPAWSEATTPTSSTCVTPAGGGLFSGGFRNNHTSWVMLSAAAPPSVSPTAPR